jgi:hypothetical protein
MISCKGSISEPEKISVLDTTSHNFDWQFDTIGIRQSYLRDVSIISPDDIWAVGEINTNDTGIPDSNGVIIRAYNAIHWNGIEWELQRIKSSTQIGSLVEDPILSVYAFNENDIWMFSYAGSYIHWNGIEWDTKFIWEAKGSVYTIWGFSSNDLYFAGTNGSLTHYDGSSFTLIPTGTDLDIDDIYGTVDPVSGGKEILFVASNSPFDPPGRQIYRLEGTQSIPVNSDSLPNLLATLWFANNKKYYVAGDGLWHTGKLGQSWTKEQSLLPYFTNDIYGLNQNDIFIVGDFGFIAHFNGINWHNYTEISQQLFSGGFGDVDFQGNFVVAVGSIGLNALMLRGYRQ